MILIILSLVSVAWAQSHSPITQITNCDNSTFDVVFVLDSSGSVGEQNFTVMKQFVKEVVGNLQIGPTATQVGLITFSRFPIMRIKLGQYKDDTSLLAAVDNVPYLAGITETNSALDLLRNEGFLGSRPNTPNIAIVVTDGRSFHANQTAKAATDVKNDGTTVFAIGIGTEINQLELNAIASDPDSKYVFTVKDFNSLRTIVNTITKRTCDVKVINPTAFPPVVQTTAVPITNISSQTTECNRTLADISFVLDSSGSLGPDNFKLVKQFVINVVSQLDIGANYTHVGVITFSNYPNRRINMNTYFDKLQLLNAINQIPYFPGNTETDKALDLLRIEGFEGDRPDAPNIAIVVTDGLSTNPELTKTASESLKNSGVTTFAIGIGAEIDTRELDTISSEPNNNFVFYVANFTDLSSIENRLAKTTCEVPLITTTTTTTAVPTTAKPTTTPTTLPPTTTTTTPTTTTPSCFAKIADVMFVVDSSGSVGEDNFNKIREFIKQLIGVFDVSSQYTRVGAISFSTDAAMEFPLDKYNTVPELNAAVDSMVYSQGGTNTAAALEMLRLQGFTKDRANAPNIAVVITDGYSRDHLATKNQATLVKAGGDVTIVAIGIGNATDYTELTDIATKDTNNKSLVYQIGDFEALQTLQRAVAIVTCGNQVLYPEVTTAAPPTPTPSDCMNTVANCADYGFDICHDYEPWSRAHCALHCGFCKGPPTTPPPCVDTVNCVEYGTYICTSNSLFRWTQTHCRKYCGFCDGGTMPTEAPTTPAPTSAGMCRDAIGNCDSYGGKEICKDASYEAWSRANCAEYCGFCTNYLRIKGTPLPGNQTCPDWLLPKTCRLVSDSPHCCPTPLCPPGYTLSVQLPEVQ